MSLKMKCKKHPRYQAKRQPRADCDACWEIWLEESPNEFVSERIKYIDPEDLTGFIEEVVDLLKSFSDYEKSGYSNLHIETEHWGYDGGVSFKLVGHIEETAADKKKRINRDRKALKTKLNKEQKTRERELKQLKRLKEKYESS